MDVKKVTDESFGADVMDVYGTVPVFAYVPWLNKAEIEDMPSLAKTTASCFGDALAAVVEVDVEENPEVANALAMIEPPAVVLIDKGPCGMSRRAS